MANRATAMSNPMSAMANPPIGISDQIAPMLDRTTAMSNPARTMSNPASTMSNPRAQCRIDDRDGKPDDCEGESDDCNVESDGRSGEPATRGGEPDRCDGESDGGEVLPADHNVASSGRILCPPTGRSFPPTARLSLFPLHCVSVSRNRPAADIVLGRPEGGGPGPGRALAASGLVGAAFRRRIRTPGSFHHEGTENTKVTKDSRASGRHFLVNSTPPGFEPGVEVHC
jgi:hypothetical protein